ncbi:hypothetical protein FMN50_07475 [Rhodobacterales bacterium]|nr:hypothetical protein FMN50_07475 [Rhodobacterales bacterium]
MTASPIIITSPIAGCGTSLLQRLVTGSANGICYGEVPGRRFAELCDFAHREMVAVQENQQRQSLDWNEAFGGDVDLWLDHLDLPGDFPKHALAGAVRFYKDHIDEATRAMEMDVWALKVDALEFTHVTRIADLVNDLKCLFIYRNIFDVIRAQKARGLIADKQKLLEACIQWVKNTEVIAALKRRNFENLPTMLHVMQYEDLVENADAHISSLESFADLHGMKPDVIALDTDDATSHGLAELTAEETDSITTVCGSRMQEIYPAFNLLH